MYNTQQKGFSLIELVVTISLVSVIAAGGMAAYNRFTQRQRIVNVGKEMENLFREAQKKAQSGDKPEVCYEPGKEFELNSWKVSKEANENAVSLNVVCTNRSNSTEVIDVPVKTIELPSTVQTNPPSLSIPFDVLTGRPEVAGGTITIEIGTGLDSPTNPRNTLMISSSGGIQNVGYVTPREEDRK